MTWREKGLTYAVVVPFAIFLAFPFYFALVTMFKTNLDLANVEHTPYLYNDLQGGFHWDFWNYATTEHVRFLFEDTNYPKWLLNTLLVGAAVVGITLLLAVPAEKRLSHILVATKAEATAIRAEATAENFTQLARERSTDPAAGSSVTAKASTAPRPGWS